MKRLDMVKPCPWQPMTLKPGGKETDEWKSRSRRKHSNKALSYLNYINYEGRVIFDPAFFCGSGSFKGTVGIESSLPEDAKACIREKY